MDATHLDAAPVDGSLIVHVSIVPNTTRTRFCPTRTVTYDGLDLETLEAAGGDWAAEVFKTKHLHGMAFFFFFLFFFVLVLFSFWLFFS